MPQIEVEGTRLSVNSGAQLMEQSSARRTTRAETAYQLFKMLRSKIGCWPPVCDHSPTQIYFLCGQGRISNIHHAHEDYAYNGTTLRFCQAFNSFWRCSMVKVTVTYRPKSHRTHGLSVAQEYSQRSMRTRNVENFGPQIFPYNNSLRWLLLISSCPFVFTKHPQHTSR